MERSIYIKKIIKERSELDPNNPVVYDYWDKLADELSKDEAFTLNFLKECGEEEIYWISEVFEDISAKLNSWKYINCLKELDKKFPQLKLAQDIQEAIDFMS